MIKKEKYNKESRRRLLRRAAVNQYGKKDMKRHFTK